MRGRVGGVGDIFCGGLVGRDGAGVLWRIVPYVEKASV